MRGDSPKSRQLCVYLVHIPADRDARKKNSLTFISFMNAAFTLTFAHHLSQEDRMANAKTSTAKRGFAAMDPAKQREIASKGGKASHGGGRPPSSGRRTAQA